MRPTKNFTLVLALAAVCAVSSAWAFTSAATTAQDGRSVAKAIVIGADDDAAAVKAENSWLAQHYSSYQKVGQSLLVKGQNHFDAIQIQDAEGNRKTVYFNVSKAFNSLLKMFG